MAESLCQVVSKPPERRDVAPFPSRTGIPDDARILATLLDEGGGRRKGRLVRKENQKAEPIIHDA